MTDLRFVGFVGFVPSELDEVHRDEIWTYETDTIHHGKDEDGRYIITLKMRLTMPEKCLASRSNAHP